MPKVVDVVCLYEKALRELDVLCAIKALAARRGIDVEIVQQDYGHGQALTRYRPRLVVLPFCYQNRSNNIYLMRWRKAIFVNLSWEQFFYPGNRIAKTPRGTFALNHVMHFSWSAPYSDLLRRAGVPPQHIFVSGNPTLGLYRPTYRSYFASRAALADRYKLDPTRTWVFFPENYNWAFYESSMLEQMVSDGQSAKDVSAMVEFATMSFEAAMRSCDRLVREQRVELILRPRPATPPQIMRDRVAAVIGAIPPRFNILQDETVREWNLVSDVVVSSYSTSLIEAAAAGKRILLLEPYTLPNTLVQSWHHLAPRVRTYEELRDGVRRQVPETSSALAEWATANLSGPGDPIEATVDFLERALSGRTPLPPTAPRSAVTYGCPDNVPVTLWWAWKQAKSLLSQAKSLSRWRRTVAMESVADIDASFSIPDRVKRWDTCLPAA